MRGAEKCLLALIGVTDVNGTEALFVLKDSAVKQTGGPVELGRSLVCPAGAEVLILAHVAV